MSSNVFIQFSNGVKGESEDENHPGSAGWSEVTKFEFKMNQQAIPDEDSSQPENPKTKHTELKVTKYIDSASPLYIQGCMNATVYDKVKVEFFRATTKDGTSDPIPYQIIELKDVIIKKYELEYSEGELVADVIELEYSEFKFAYTPMNKQTGAAGSVKPVTHNLKTNAVT
jgi:type VI secretion system Hcp family effector